MIDYTDGYVNIDGTKIHYYRMGAAGPPFVLLHGATDNGLCWSRVAKQLADKYDVIMPDAQGHGLSDRFDEGFNSGRHVEQVAGLVRQLGIDKPVIMGHSMGADTAANLAFTHPSLPKAIILEDPPWGMRPPPVPVDEAARKEQEAFRESLVSLHNLALEEIIEEGRKRDPGWSDEDRLVWAKAKQQFDPSLFSRPIIFERPYEELVAKIQCPTLLIIGDTGIVTAEVAENAARMWKSEQPYQWVQIKNATHNIRRDRFDEYCGKLFCFLQALPD